MAQIRATDTPAQTGPGIPDEALGPGEDAAFESELEQLEKQLREDRDHRLLRENPDGIGPTLGQNLATPPTGHDVADADWEDEDYDPPT